MLPVVGPGSVRQHIANGVAGNGLAIIAGQQIAPCGITIGVVDGALHRPQRAGGVGIFLFAQDVACIIISPDLGHAHCLVIITGQLVGGVIDSPIVEGMRP